MRSYRLSQTMRVRVIRINDGTIRLGFVTIDGEPCAHLEIGKDGEVYAELTLTGMQCIGVGMTLTEAGRALLSKHSVAH
jgi:hypothetical protein